MRYRASIFLGLAYVLAGVAMAQAAPPLIYEGTLTNGDQPPDPWPGLRFSVVDAGGVTWWSTMVEPHGPLIEVGPDGRFVAYLEDSPENPWAVAGFDQGRWLRVEVCPGAWPANPADDCQWVQLEQTQRLGTVPMAETISEAERARIRAGALEDARADIWVRPDVPGGDVATLRVALPPRAGTFSSVNAALASLDQKLIPAHMIVEIRIEPADEAYVDDERILIRHPDGERIHIIGETPEPGSFREVVLEFRNSGAMLIENGSHIGWVNGVTLRGDLQGSNNGVVVRRGATASFGRNVFVEGFTSDCFDVYGGYLTARGVTVRRCGGHGIHVGYGGYAGVAEAIAEELGGRGYRAYVGGRIYADGAQSDRGDAGFSSVTEGWIVR